MAISDTIFFIYYFFIMAISDTIFFIYYFSLWPFQIPFFHILFFHYGHFRCHFFIYYFFIMAISDAIFSYIIFSYGTVSNIPFFAFHELHTVAIACLFTVLSLRVKGAGLYVWYNLT